MNPLDLERRIRGSLSPAERSVRLATLWALLGGEPPSVRSLAKRTGLLPKIVARAVTRLAELGLMVCDDSGRVVGSWGLSLAPTCHRLRMFDRLYFTWCAEDVVGIPAALGADATVESICFQCGRQVTERMRQGEIAHALPDGLRIWIAEASAGRSVVGST